MAALEISGLTFAYAGSEAQWALHDLSLRVNEGEIVCILGASGCGKSTLLNLIAGLLQPSSGSVAISHATASNARIGYIFQTDALFPWRTVEANLLLATELGGEERCTAREQLLGYLKAFHLQDDILTKYPAQLSGGMRQRASIIQSLMFNPQLLLLDEPFSALDFYTKLRLESEFYQLVKHCRGGDDPCRGGDEPSAAQANPARSAILVTHDIEEAIAIGDRILLMNRAGQFCGEFTIDLPGPRDPEAARGTPQFAEYYQRIWSELKGVIADV